MTVATLENVAKLYVATFNRAPLQTGLNYWVNSSGLALEGIARSFFDQVEAQALYPAGTSNEIFVRAIYQNLFNRAPLQSGLDYWIGPNGLGGSITRDVMILAVINGAYGTDAEKMANKTEVGLYYTASGLPGRNFSLANVTDDDATMDAAKLIVDTSVKASAVSLSVDTGTLEVPVTFDAGIGSFNFTDDASVLTSVVINNFTANDRITISNAPETDYSFCNDGADVNISFNNNGTMNIISLIGVVDSNLLVYDQASFEAAIGFNAFTG